MPKQWVGIIYCQHEMTGRKWLRVSVATQKDHLWLTVVLTKLRAFGREWLYRLFGSEVEKAMGIIYMVMKQDKFQETVTILRERKWGYL